MNDLWKQRYEELTLSIRDLIEDTRLDFDEVPVEPISVSDYFYISNDWQICDNEEYAIEHWGPGKYAKYSKCDGFDIAIAALKKISGMDYRGNRSTEMHLAFEALEQIKEIK